MHIRPGDPGRTDQAHKSCTRAKRASCPASAPHYIPSGKSGCTRLRRAPFFGERLDLKGCRATAADLLSKKSQILFYTLKKSFEIGLVAHVRCIARRQRWAVVSKIEDAMSLAQQRTREA